MALHAGHTQHFESGAPFSLIGRRRTDDSRAHRTITSLAVTLILTLSASLASSWYDSTSTPIRWSSFHSSWAQLSEPSAPAQHPHQHQRQVDQQQRCEFQTTRATRCNVARHRRASAPRKSSPDRVPCASGFWVPPAGRELGSRIFRAVGSVGSAI